MRRADIRTHAGFTLVEMIVTMVVLAIVAGMAAVFIRAPAASYGDAAARAELTDLADTVLRRMSREVRLALPNSVRVSGNTIEMLVTRTGGRYLAADDGIPGDVLDFHGPGLSFTVVGDMPAGKQTITPGDRIVVFNLGPGFAPADAYTNGNAAVVGGVTGNVVTLQSNPFDDPVPPMPSPASRFHVVREAVRYTCIPGAGGTGTMTRSSGYDINPDIAAPLVNGVTALAANRVAACAFDVVTLGTTRAALVILNITLQIPGSSDGPVTLTHQIHVDNTP